MVGYASFSECMLEEGLLDSIGYMLASLNGKLPVVTDPSDWWGVDRDSSLLMNVVHQVSVCFRKGIAMTLSLIKRF